MNKINIFLTTIFLLLSMTACEDYLGGDINADPNNPTSVPVAAQFPAIQIAMADNYGGDFSRFCTMLSQQVEGVARQWVAFNQYTGLTPNRFDDAWQNVYENILNEIKVAKASATENGLNHHLAIMEISEAFTLMIATDVWDDIPYSSGLQGIQEQNPAFDSQETIYNTVYSLLDSGIALLGGSAGPAAPGAEDVFYGGDAGSWIKAANALKARGLLHQGNYAGAMAAAMTSFSSAADNMAFQYPDANAAYGWFRFNRDRTGDLEFHPQMRELMTSLGDTDRLAAFDQEFTTDHPFLVANFNSEMVSYREMQFLIAECAFRAGDTATANAAYLAGIAASFDRVGTVTSDTYITNTAVNPGAAGLTLEHIMTQKYIGLFVQPEVYNDFRRTGIPALTPVSGASVPVRWDYSSDEYLFNSNLVEGSVNIFTDKVGWNR